MSTTLKGSKIEKYLIGEITELGLEYVGDLRLENGDYIFTVEVPENEKVTFENKVFEVVEIETNWFSGCFVKLKITADYVNFAVSKSQKKDE